MHTQVFPESGPTLPSIAPLLDRLMANAPIKNRRLSTTA